MKSQIYYHVYISQATQPFTSEELTELLRKARENNSKLGVTGLLLYQDGVFMQALEGSEEAVTSLVNRIEADPRHRRMMKLLSGHQTERQFPDWSMGFRDLNAPELRRVPGYSDFLEQPLDADRLAQDGERCRQVLDTFRKLAY